MPLFKVDTPLARHILTQLRDRNTNQVLFRKNLVRLGRLIGYEIANTMEVEEVTVETPLSTLARGVRIVGLERVVIVNVMRAATPLVEGLLKAFPSARQGVVVAKRKEGEFDSPPKEMEVDIHYYKFPDVKEEDNVIIADPMVATGSTILKVLELMRTSKAKKYYVASVLSSRYGVDRITKQYPYVNIFTVEVDPEINSMGYIVPGLGDAGDRAFG
ncbi:uracil phosphoribosyltransferase [Sulfodiicoccus acidiphilus]|uniref:Uracil phosphoribosyltransferase n=1 Tax=Sulfodiicoccus acidiphilus TaxID=1670455 RepID=A0A348B0D7_9CREN|nr:uracil phosphoribosyltransferase [Sulfodiicoccus acidiphilus]BBD71639.1 uracil phosphoribosyltransferase [Sulfodiicoccus acidiphilus]GGT86925.1 uracil phosphoribosyltransferase [Sulfodiicoccus acidiphilus]